MNWKFIVLVYNKFPIRIIYLQNSVIIQYPLSRNKILFFKLTCIFKIPEPDVNDKEYPGNKPQ